MIRPFFKLYVGPMASGKTTRLLEDAKRSVIAKKRVMLFKPKIDDRYSNVHEIVTHDGKRLLATPVTSGNDILHSIINETSVPQHIAVDEAFMIEDIGEALVSLYRTGVSISVASLDMTASCKQFQRITSLYQWATEVVKCTAVCVSCGDEAHYTYKKLDDNEDIKVGGLDIYESRCYKCHPKVRL